MSLAEKMQPHMEEFESGMQDVEELMLKSESGKYVIHASVFMSETEEMADLMILLGSGEIREEERITLIKYMGEMLKRNPAQGMKIFSEYLKSIADNPKYVSKKEHYQKASDAAMAVGNTQEYKDYVVVYQYFETDKAPEAVAARQAMQAMQEKMQKFSVM